MHTGRAVLVQYQQDLDQKTIFKKQDLDQKTGIYFQNTVPVLKKVMKEIFPY